MRQFNVEDRVYFIVCVDFASNKFKNGFGTITHNCEDGTYVVASDTDGAEYWIDLKLDDYLELETDYIH